MECDILFFRLDEWYAIILFRWYVLSVDGDHPVHTHILHACNSVYGSHWKYAKPFTNHTQSPIDRTMKRTSDLNSWARTARSTQPYKRITTTQHNHTECIPPYINFYFARFAFFLLFWFVVCVCLSPSISKLHADHIG